MRKKLRVANAKSVGMPGFYGVLTGGLVVGTLLFHTPWLGFVGSFAAFLCFVLIMYAFLLDKSVEVILKWRKRRP